MSTNNNPAGGSNVVPLLNAPSVETFMRDDLCKSGLTPTEIGAELYLEPFTKTPVGYLIPYWLPDGTRHPAMYRVRLAQPKPGGGKYSQPDKAAFPDGTYPYLPPQNNLPQLHRGPDAPPLIVEGEKKALAAIKFLNRVAYGIGGCWNWSQTTDEGLHRLHPELGARFRAGEKVEIVFDGDLMHNDDVQRAAGTLRRRLIGMGLTPVFVMLPAMKKGGGLDEWLMAVHGRGVPVDVEFDKLPRTDGRDFLEAPIDAWHDLKLAMTATKVPVNNESNVVRILTGHDYFHTLRFNTTMKRMELETPDGPLVDGEVLTFITVWLQSRLAMHKVSVANVRVALDLLCTDTSPIAYNAVAEKLYECEALWDQQPRVDEFLIRALAIADTPYHRAASRAFFVGAARRALQPGCKMDYVLVLSGQGGISKTTFFQRIAMDREWVKEVTEAFDKNKDGRMALTRGWLVEASEGVSLEMSSAGGMKAIITDTCDEFRPPYGTALHRYPRRTVIVASTNDDAILKYEAGTGNRRFMPISARKADLALIEAEIEQVWGEATAMVKAGVREWEGINGGPSLEDLARPEVAAHTEMDPWVDDLRGYLNDRTKLHSRPYRGVKGFAVASHDLLTGALGLLPDRKLSTHGKRLRRAMAAIEGWERIESTERVHGKIATFTGYWHPAENPTDTGHG